MTGWWTFGLQIVNFLALVWLLRRFLYRPVLATIAERRKRDEAAAAEVTAARDAAKQAGAAIEAERAGLAGERARVIDEARDRARAEADEVLAEAKLEADTIVATGRRALADERAAALETLEAHAVELGTALATRLLAQVGSAAIDDAFLGRIEAYLDGLAPERRTGLATEAMFGIEVVTAHPLPPDAQARWRDRVSAHLGTPARLTFSSDPALIAGVEVRFRSAIIHLSWRDTLGNARGAVGSHAVAG
jgi:F0F1-type ATP synthase membrane subunit b/b'